MKCLPRVIFVLSMGGPGALVASQMGQPAHAQPAAAPVPAATLPFQERPPTLDHRSQLGVALMPGIGYRVIARYQEGQRCLDASGDPARWVCTSGVPMFMDLQLGYGLTSRLDVLTDVRLGLGRESGAPAGRQLAVAPGIRVWLDRDVRLKFFTTVQALIDVTSQGQASVRNTDFGLRNSNGLMYDALRNVGVYLQLGESIGLVRWFRIELDVGLGLQVRLP
jgi:hypothetical protein